MSNKFNIGDKVKVTSNLKSLESYQTIRAGQIGTVLENSFCPYVKFDTVDDDGYNINAFHEWKLELYVAEDETKHNFKVGDLVNFELNNTKRVGQIKSIDDDNVEILYTAHSKWSIDEKLNSITLYNNPFKVGQKVILNNKIAIIKEFVGHLVKIISGQHPNNVVEYVEFTSINPIEEPIVLNTNFQIGDKVMLNRKFNNNDNYNIEYEISDMYINEFNEVMCKLTHIAEELAEDLVLIDDIDIT